jgi:hypothetical protein
VKACQISSRPRPQRRTRAPSTATVSVVDGLVQGATRALFETYGVHLAPGDSPVAITSAPSSWSASSGSRPRRLAGVAAARQPQQRVLARRGADGTVIHHNVFIEWVLPDIERQGAANTAYHALLARALSSLATVWLRLDQPGVAARYESEAQSVARLLHTRFWDREAGALRDGLRTGARSTSHLPISSAWPSLWDYLSTQVLGGPLGSPEPSDNPADPHRASGGQPHVGTGNRPPPPRPDPRRLARRRRPPAHVRERALGRCLSRPPAGAVGSATTRAEWGDAEAVRVDLVKRTPSRRKRWTACSCPRHLRQSGSD